MQRIQQVVSLALLRIAISQLQVTERVVPGSVQEVQVGHRYQRLSSITVWGI